MRCLAGIIECYIESTTYNKYYAYHYTKETHCHGVKTIPKIIGHVKTSPEMSANIRHKNVFNCGVNVFRFRRIPGC
jgi:hypothetical protein